MKTFKEYLNEQKQLDEAGFAVEVSVRDSRQANDLAQDSYRGLYKNDGSNVFVFKKESDKEDFVNDLLDMNLEILEESAINEAKYDFLTPDEIKKLKAHYDGNPGLRNISQAIKDLEADLLAFKELKGNMGKSGIDYMVKTNAWLRKIGKEDGVL